jgi:hypothetical protein
LHHLHAPLSLQILAQLAPNSNEVCKQLGSWRLWADDADRHTFRLKGRRSCKALLPILRVHVFGHASNRGYSSCCVDRLL